MDEKMNEKKPAGAAEDNNSEAAKGEFFGDKNRVIQPGIGINGLPASILNSLIFNQHDLAQLATVEIIPLIDPAFDDDTLKNIIQYYSINPDEMEKELHIYAHHLLKKDKVNEAWQILLALI